MKHRGSVATASHAAAGLPEARAIHRACVLDYGVTKTYNLPNFYFTSVLSEECG
jgi:hypothetical protein